MKFKIDENLPVDVAEELRARGHDAETVVDEGLAGNDDGTIVAHAQREGRAMITLDKGVADIRSYPPADHSGIILLRPGRSGRNSSLEFLRANLDTILSFDLAGRLVVVSEHGIRLR